LPTLKKIKNANTQADTARQESKMTMTEKLNIDNSLQDWKTEHQSVTKAICNKGFNGNSSILPRSFFSVGGQESSPQSLLHIASTVVCHAKKTTVHKMNEMENRGCQTTFGTFASTDQQADASACKRAKFLPPLKPVLRVKTRCGVFFGVHNHIAFNDIICLKLHLKQ
jgi:hypothetical protein